MSSPGRMSLVATRHFPLPSLTDTLKGKHRPSLEWNLACWEQVQTSWQSAHCSAIGWQIWVPQRKHASSSNKFINNRVLREKVKLTTENWDWLSVTRSRVGDWWGTTEHWQIYLRPPPSTHFIIPLSQQLKTSSSASKQLPLFRQHIVLMYIDYRAETIEYCIVVQCSATLRGTLLTV